MIPVVYKILSIMTSELEGRIEKLEKGRRDTDAENIKWGSKIYGFGYPDFMKRKS